MKMISDALLRGAMSTGALRHQVISYMWYVERPCKQVHLTDPYFRNSDMVLGVSGA